MGADDEDQPLASDSAKKISSGGKSPIASDRGCTDVYCVFVYIGAWVGFVFLTLAGFQDGNPHKLYLPRDYSGAYCDTKTNWNNGPNLEGFEKLSFTMNVTATTDLIVKQLLCSSAVRDVLTSGASPLLPQSERKAYLCDCCLSPCAKCTGSFKTGGDLTSSNLQSTLTGKMSELNGQASPTSFFSGSGSNGDFFSSVLNDATKYFNKVCLPDCNTDFAMMNSSSDNRSYVYAMSPDNPLARYWDLLTSSSTTPQFLKDTINSQFTFAALPSSLCPYNASKCVPMPGIAFGNQPGGYCSVDISSDVTQALGSAATEAFGGLVNQAFSNDTQAIEGLGEAMGELGRILDTIAIVCLSSFVIGLVYMLLLRFFVGICVWFAIFMIFVIFILSGAATWTRAHQCKGTSLFDTGIQATVSVAVYAEAVGNAALSGEQFTSEKLEGDGANYTGIQKRTKSGYSCIDWGQYNSANSEAQTYSAFAYPNSNLEKNYCRNPYNASDQYKAATIWCFTADFEVKWEECTPIGIIAPECRNGYEIPDEWLREFLKVMTYIFLGLALVYFLLICCVCSRIQLAIVVNKVAAAFMSQSPLVVLVPVFQAFSVMIWIVAWSFCAAFLLSQVPDGYTPKDAYATYAEAAGTNSTPGKCTDKWPTGSVWKDEACDMVEVNGTIEPRCWRCAPPRYVFDLRFAGSFFHFLWTNQVNVALGQCVLAGAVAAWFFTPNKNKGGLDMGLRTVSHSVWNVFRYHFGSLAVGAFVIAVVQFIRAVIYYFQKQAEAQKNKVAEIALRICQCCMWCLEKCLKFLTKNAYIQIAIKGTNFCTSARRAFFVILNNAIRFSTIIFLSGIIHWIGFCFIVASTGGLGYVLLDLLHPEAKVIVPMILFVVVGYFMSMIFMNVFGLAVDTVLQCFIECEENKIDGDFVPSQMANLLKQPDSLNAEKVAKE